MPKRAPEYWPILCMVDYKRGIFYSHLFPFLRAPGHPSLCESASPSLLLSLACYSPLGLQGNPAASAMCNYMRPLCPQYDEQRSYGDRSI